MDLQSILGYADNSPYRNNPYLDIQTPEGFITMENTSVDLLGIDNLGNIKKMKARRRKPYKFQGNIVREIPMQQGGVKPPIYTSNPNDPRLRAYNDSLILNNYSEIGLKSLASAKNTEVFNEYWKNTPQSFTAAYSRLGNPKPIKEVEKMLPLPDGSMSHYPSGVYYYKKPVQPVIYQKPQRILSTSQAQLNIPNLSGNGVPNVNIQMPQMPQGYDYSKPTKYAFAMPDENGKQRNIYFPTKKALQDFMNGARGVSSQEGNDYMTATGYMQQGGVKSPIYTNNPNDPRLRAYQDSLALYKGSIKALEWAKKEHAPYADNGEEPYYVPYTKGDKDKILNFATHGDPNNMWSDWKFSNPIINQRVINMPDLELKSIRNTKILPIGHYGNIDYSGGYRFDVSKYKKPVQPVIYNPRQLETAKAQLSIPNLSQGELPQVNVQAPNVQGYDYSKPTKYSFTFPTEGYNNQKSMYFPDKESLRYFMKGAKGVSSQEGQDYMTATGYMKKGGLSAGKAAEMLKDGTAHGHKLTKAQKRYFQAISHGWKPKGQFGGGFGVKDIYDFLYEDDDNKEASKDFVPTAPVQEDIQQDNPDMEQNDPDEQLALMVAMGDFSSRNPYIESNPTLKRAIGVNPYLKQTESDILGNYDATSLGIWGDKSHQMRQSDHNTGDAEDFGVSDPNIGKSIVNKLQSEASQRKIKYIIYNGRIWNPSISNDWRKYTGNDPHSTHIHVSYNR